MVEIGREKIWIFVLVDFLPSTNPSKILIILFPHDKASLLKTDKNISKVWKGDFRQPDATMSFLIV